MFSDKVKTFGCDHNSWRWARCVGGEGSMGRGVWGGECGEGSMGRGVWVGGRELIQFENSNFHDSLQAISLVSPSPHYHCQLRTETVEIAR